MTERSSVVKQQKTTAGSGLLQVLLRSILPWIGADRAGKSRLNPVSDQRGSSDNDGTQDPMQRLLSIEGLSQSWPDQAEALFNIESVNWHADQHIWLQGGNGSGKTTLMRLISGLEPVQDGDICSHATNDADERRICYLHQTPYLFAGSVERNLNFVIRSLKADKRPAAREALELGLKLAGLESLRFQDAVTLSGGERQRLALLRAWLLQPDLLLLDEPAANLDDDSVALMHRLVTDLIDKGAVIMVSSHQQNLLTDLCNTRWSISSGTLAASSIVM